MQLGVWRLPERVSSSYDTTSTDYDPSAPSITSTPASAPPDTNQWTLDEILDYNKDIVHNQRGTYDLLRQMLQETMQQEEELEKHAAEHQDTVEGEDGDYVNVDPLTAIVQQRDAQEQRLTELDLKFRKRRAQRKRGVVDGEGESSDRHDTYSVRFFYLCVYCMCASVAVN